MNVDSPTDAAITNLEQVVSPTLTNEVVLTGTDGVKNLAQTISVNRPGALFYNPTNNNFYFAEFESFDPDWQFVEIIRGVNP